jgi:transposase
VESTAHITENDLLRVEIEALRAQLLASEKREHEYLKKLVDDQKQLDEYREKYAADEYRLAQLEYELQQLKRLIFGVKSERFVPAGGPDQLPLFEEVPSHGSTNDSPAREPIVGLRSSERPRRKAKRQVLPSHLPRKVIVIEPDEDTSGLKKIGAAITETLDYYEPKLVVIRRERPKYVDPQDEERGVVIGALPDRPIEKGMAEAGLLAHVVIEKYVDHLPLYRQAARFKREGIEMAASTLGDWTAGTADLLVPLYEVLQEAVLASGYIQADETPIRVQDPKRTGKTHQGYYWVYYTPEKGLAFFDYRPGRGGEGAKALLSTYQGALQSDGYQVYEAYDDCPGIVAYNCWAHARRYFEKALENEPDLAEHALTEIGLLYDIERVLREGDASPGKRRQLRQEKAVPILERFRAWLEANTGLPRSPWGQAVSYSLGRWKKLIRYTQDGRIEIDNNLIENKIRPVAIGRRNYLFSGSHAAAQRAAVIYSLLASCKQHEVNPQAWLSDVLSRLPRHPHKRVHELLPHHWKNRQG